ncbi:60S ribosomal protein L7-1 isoform X2 [Hevea brasiliensis]|uniref:60S ribosomal protein L7-1 isoform X2 n=1 Tax=Hevea brasiliensis TaxID=3981 RepID=UPI0025D61BF3|nr:60S ribosomal protein L7-1 isoform X2 [Hevea brasiliensis]
MQLYIDYLKLSSLSSLRLAAATRLLPTSHLCFSFQGEKRIVMAEGETKAMAYIPEVILKKRKHKEESLALTRKTQLEFGKYGGKKRKVEDIKRPEQFIKEFRDKELDLIRMKQRTKRPKSASLTPKSKLLFIIRIQGKNDMHPKTRKILYNLKLRRIFHGVFMKATAGVLEMLQRVEPYVTFGYPNPKNVSELIYKKGYGMLNKQRVPLIDNTIIEQALGKHGILCLEDIVHEIANVGPHFKEITNFLGPFALSKPKGGLQGKRASYKDGGDTGNREDEINDLIDKMN